ncbi:hypothetical protein HRbin24_02119 [bacterium HR24]|nr:hypothetical protein HRbin24_02119 [bacterium HR24]
MDGDEIELAADGGQVTVVALHQSHIAAELGQPLSGHSQRFAVQVDAQEQAAGGGRVEDGLGMAAGADGAIDVAAAGLHVQRLHHLIGHDGDVEDWFEHLGPHEHGLSSLPT